MDPRHHSGAGVTTALVVAGLSTILALVADARCVSLESVNYPGRYLRHQNFAVFLHRIVLRALNYPDRYLVVRDSLLFLDRIPARRAMALVVRPPL
jgi:hypothetical protein